MTDARDERTRLDVGALVAAYANDGEMVIALARIALCVLLLARYPFGFGPHERFFGDSPAQMIRRFTGMLICIAVSLWALRLSRARRCTLPAHLGIATFDAVFCFIALRSNVLGVSIPAHYSGLLRMPDVAFLTVLVFGSTLRLYRSAIATTFVLSTISLLYLVHLDERLHGIVAHTQDVEIVAFQFAAAGAAAFVSAWAIRRAISRLALEAERVSRGRRHLHDVLREHHDVRTLLSAAQLQIGFIRRGGESGEPSERLAAVESVGTILDGIKTRTFGELVLTDDLSRVEPLPIIESAAAIVRNRFPGVEVAVSAEGGRAGALLFGGERAFAHLAINCSSMRARGTATARLGASKFGCAQARGARIASCSSSWTTPGLPARGAARTAPGRPDHQEDRQRAGVVADRRGRRGERRHDADPQIA